MTENARQAAQDGKNIIPRQFKDESKLALHSSRLKEKQAIDSPMLKTNKHWGLHGSNNIRPRQPRAERKESLDRQRLKENQP